MEKNVQMPTKQEILEYVSKTLSEDNRDENLKKLIEILKRLVIESGDISPVKLSDECPCPTLIYDKGTTKIKIIMPDYPQCKQWHRLHLEFDFSIDEKIYRSEFLFKFSMQDCRDIEVTCGPVDENDFILRYNIEYFKCNFKNLWGSYNGRDGNLQFPNKNDETFTSERHGFKIDDFIESLEYAINYSYFSGIVNLNFVDSKDMGKHRG